MPQRRSFWFLNRRSLLFKLLLWLPVILSSVWLFCFRAHTDKQIDCSPQEPWLTEFLDDEHSIYPVSEGSPPISPAAFAVARDNIQSILPESMHQAPLKTIIENQGFRIAVAPDNHPSLTHRDKMGAVVATGVAVYEPGNNRMLLSERGTVNPKQLKRTLSNELYHAYFGAINCDRHPDKCDSQQEPRSPVNIEKIYEMISPTLGPDGKSSPDVEDTLDRAIQHGQKKIQKPCQAVSHKFMEKLKRNLAPKKTKTTLQGLESAVVKTKEQLDVPEQMMLESCETIEDFQNSYKHLTQSHRGGYLLEFSSTLHELEPRFLKAYFYPWCLFHRERFGVDLCGERSVASCKV